MRSINWIKQTGLVLWLGISCPVATAWSAESEEFPAFQEVYNLIRTNASALNEKELNRAAVLGLLDQLKGQAGLTGRKSVRVYRPTASSARMYSTGPADICAWRACKRAHPKISGWPCNPFSGPTT